MSCRAASSSIFVDNEDLLSCTICHADGKLFSNKWAHQDSNLGPAGYEPAALTTELWARFSFRQTCSIGKELFLFRFMPLLQLLQSKSQLSLVAVLLDLAQLPP